MLSYYHLVRDPLVLVVARDHPAADPDPPVDLRALRNESWLAAPSGEPSRQAADRLLAAVGLTPPVPSEFEGLGTVANLVARGLGIAIMPQARRRRLRAAGGGPRAAGRPRPGQGRVRGGAHGVGGRPSVAVIVSALRGAARAMTRQAASTVAQELQELREP